MSNIPENMQPPPAEHPQAGGDWFPHIIRHDVQDDGTVLVTWALPGLATATVRVGWTEWCRGEHAATGPFIASLIAPIQAQLKGTQDHVHNDDEV